MPKKRPQRRHSRQKPGKRQKTARNSGPSGALEDLILHFMHQTAAPATLTEIARGISGRRRADGEISGAVSSLVHARLLVPAERKTFRLAKNVPLYSGRMHLHPKGFGFVAAGLEQDVYIPSRRTGSAMHGDTVLIRLRSPKESDRPEGTVISILERGPSTVAGFYREHGGTGLVIPEDSRFPFSIRVRRDGFPDLKEGDIVIASFIPPESPRDILEGAIEEHLGSPDTIDVQMRLVIERFRLPHRFSPEALEEADRLRLDTVDGAREDLRQLQHVTIDGESAKDFADAVAVIKKGQGFQLYVSIADVSHYVQQDSPLDREAYERGTSIYFPGRVIPMLPEKLSNDLCSLVPDEDRLTVTAILDFDGEGRRVGTRFCRSLIRSHKRFTYTEVYRVLQGRDQTAVQRNAVFLTMLRDAEQLARLLLARRNQRGSIGFTLPEPEILLKDDGTIDTIRRAERNFAHQIIEEFMLAANEAVAETFTRNKRHSLYRIHELPDRAKVFEFAGFAATLGLELPKPELTPQWFGQVLACCKGSTKEYVVNNLLLRTMQQACYSPENKGHFALAAADYTHFTSPIRRYPDLLVHRELCQLIQEQAKKTTGKRATYLKENSGEFLSARERTAIDSEREMNDRLKLLYMEKHLGEDFQAIISGVTDFAIFVELLDLFVSGSIPLENLEDDYYMFDGRNHRVLGEISGRIFQIGDSLTVRATSVDKNKTRIIFRPTIAE